MIQEAIYTQSLHQFVLCQYMRNISYVHKCHENTPHSQMLFTVGTEVGVL